MQMDTLPKKREGENMHETACQHLIYFCTWEYMKELVLSWEITDMRDILQYTMNRAVAMWM